MCEDVLRRKELSPLTVASIVGIRTTMAGISRLPSFLYSCSYLSMMAIGATTGLYPVLLPAVGPHAKTSPLIVRSQAHILSGSAWSGGAWASAWRCCTSEWCIGCSEEKFPPMPRATDIRSLRAELIEIRIIRPNRFSLQAGGYLKQSPSKCYRVL